MIKEFSRVQIKALNNLAKEQKCKYGRLRSIVDNVSCLPIHDLLHDLLTELQKESLPNCQDDILRLVFGSEGAALLYRTQNSFWFWSLVAASTEISPVSVEDGMARLRDAFGSIPERDKAIAYGYLLWDDRANKIVKNVLFEEKKTSLYKALQDVADPRLRCDILAAANLLVGKMSSQEECAKVIAELTDKHGNYAVDLLVNCLEEFTRDAN